MANLLPASVAAAGKQGEPGGRPPGPRSARRTTSRAGEARAARADSGPLSRACRRVFRTTRLCPAPSCCSPRPPPRGAAPTIAVSFLSSPEGSVALAVDLRAVEGAGEVDEVRVRRAPFDQANG